MDMHLYNDLTGRKERFEPAEPGRVTFYVCGPTVYDLFHVGNARPFIVFDALRRWFEAEGLEVDFVQNFTDIDDKMIKRAHEMGISVADLAEKFIAEYYLDADALGIHRATVNPRATHEIPAIIKMIETLIERGHAYTSDDGVYFEVATFDEYGKLSKQSIEDLHSGARVDIAEHKKSPLDFAVWKFEKPGEPAWDSPWGRGRPGWHIECSAMAERYLGTTIDIHGGGSDLIFPHHENEVAQSECAHNAHFARFWIHNGYLMIDREKMSKSLGNFFTVREVREKYAPIVIRLFMLSAHYRSPINFSKETLEQAAHASERLKNGWSELDFALMNRREDIAPHRDDVLRGALVKAERTFGECLCDDFNTAGAIGAVFEIIAATNTAVRSGENADVDALVSARGFLERADSILGIIPRGEHREDDSWIDAMIEERKKARQAKDFARSDEIRDELAAKGIILEDTPQGTRWKRR